MMQEIAGPEKTDHTVHGEGGAQPKSRAGIGPKNKNCVRHLTREKSLLARKLVLRAAWLVS